MGQLIQYNFTLCNNVAYSFTIPIRNSERIDPSKTLKNMQRSNFVNFAIVTWEYATMQTRVEITKCIHITNKVLLRLLLITTSFTNIYSKRNQFIYSIYWQTCLFWWLSLAWRRSYAKDEHRLFVTRISGPTNTLQAFIRVTTAGPRRSEFHVYSEYDWYYMVP